MGQLVIGVAYGACAIILHNSCLVPSPHCTAVPHVSQRACRCMTPGWWIFPEAHPNRNWVSAFWIEINPPCLPGTTSWSSWVQETGASCWLIRVILFTGL